MFTIINNKLLFIINNSYYLLLYSFNIINLYCIFVQHINIFDNNSETIQNTVSTLINIKKLNVNNK